MVDIGAQVSGIPATWRDKHSGACNQTLQAANGTPITTYGARNVLLQHGKHRYTARLIKADVKRPLFGSDFFRHHAQHTNGRTWTAFN